MDGYITIGTELDTKSFDTQIKQVEKELDFVEDMLEKKKEYKLSTEAIEKFSLKAEKLRNQLVDLRKKQEALNKQGYNNMLSSLGNVGDSIQSVTKKVVKWGLAFLGLRSIISLVRQSIGTLSQYDDQMSADIEYMRYALAVALKPVIETILNLVKQLLFYVGYLAKAWFNVDLFGKASAKNFASANKQAKKLEKTLSSFDEMNVLQNNNSAGGGAGATMPSFDLSDMSQMEVPKWLEWIKDHGKEIAAAIGLIIGSKVLGGAGGLTGLLGLAAAALLVYDAFKYKELYDEWKDLQKLRKELNKMDKEIHQQTVQAIDDRSKEAEAYEKGSQQVAQFTGALGSNIEMSLSNIKTGKLTAEQLEREIIEIDKSVEAYKKLYEQGKLTNKQTREYKDLMGQLGLKVDGTKMGFKDFTDYIKWHYDKEVQDANEQTGIFGTALGNLVSNDYTIDIDTKFNEPDTSSFKSRVNAMLGDLERSFGAIAGAGIGVVTRIPKLAKGGIINQPGKGVPLAVGGEVSREGVIPLTDSQQMAMIGEAIGKYVTINLTNITKLDSRQLARKVDKVQQNDNFVFNR